MTYQQQNHIGTLYKSEAQGTNQKPGELEYRQITRTRLTTINQSLELDKGRRARALTNCHRKFQLASGVHACTYLGPRESARPASCAVETRKSLSLSLSIVSNGCPSSRLVSIICARSYTAGRAQLCTFPAAPSGCYCAH